MKRFLLILPALIGAAFLIAGCPKARKDNEYFPMKVGYQWLYETKVEGLQQPIKLEVKINRTEKVDNDECFVLESFVNSSGESLQKEYYAQTSEGVTLFKICWPDQEVMREPPELVLKTPVTVGQEWKWQGKVLDEKASYQFKVEKTERIKALDRELDCFKIIIRGKHDRGLEYEINRWFAPGIGMVKEESTRREGTKEAKMTALLKSFKGEGK
ncbi:MAG: hypothetical protein RDV48_06785 [Candidatus Eremiobacteraeota bacterium]|nr:hypothetical protein [Candidatus Eremiobacteraeota bacterium]